MFPQRLQEEEEEEEEVSGLLNLLFLILKATFTRYRTNFRPVENSYTYGFRSHGTKLNV